MSKVSLYFFFVVWTGQLNAQLCKSLFDKHLAKFPNDTRVEYGSFCNGVAAAEKSSSWSLRFATDQRFWSSCEIESYERFGVHLVFTGDIVSIEQESFNQGFNSFMRHQMNLSRPGLQDSLGLLPSGMRWFDTDLLNEFKALFIQEKQSDSVIILRLDLLSVKASYFETLDGVTIQENLSKSVYSIEELIKGVELPITLQKKIVLRPDFTHYLHSEKICVTDMITIPISLN